MPHTAIQPALRRLGIPSQIISSTATSYKRLTTTINHKGSTVEVTLQGFTQGDPLSPFIFNAVMDPLLEQLEALQGYLTDKSHTISSLAFADDLRLLADTREKAQELLGRTEQYLQKLGMKIAAAKCASLEITTTKDSWYLTDPNLHLGNCERSQSAADSTLSYLGGHFSP